MPFNVKKCKVRHFGNKKQVKFVYSMAGVNLEAVTMERDLGIMWSSDGKVSDQYVQACRKANQVLGMINRTMVNKQPVIMTRLYKSLVEYCTAVWSPHYQKDMLLVERVQRWFTKSIPSLRHLSYSMRLTELAVWRLDERRIRADLIQVYKMFHGPTVPDVSAFFTIADGRTRGHAFKLAKPRCHLDVRRYFFSDRVVDNWNALDEEAVQAATLNHLKKCIDHMRSNQMGPFTDVCSAGL